MRILVIILCLISLMGIVSMTGCDLKNEKKVEDIIDSAAYIGTLAYFDKAKPDKVKLDDIEKVTNLIKTSVDKVPAQGFVSLLPVLDAEYKKIFKNDRARQLIAKEITKELLTMLDDEYKKHPEWQKDAATVIKIVNAATAGTLRAVHDYRL